MFEAVVRGLVATEWQPGKAVDQIEQASHQLPRHFHKHLLSLPATCPRLFPVRLVAPQQSEMVGERQEAGLQQGLPSEVVLLFVFPVWLMFYFFLGAPKALLLVLVDPHRLILGVRIDQDLPQVLAFQSEFDQS